MKLISLNVGKPQQYFYKGRKGYTSIFKSAVDEERRVRGYNIEGDEQSDLTVHRGELKAVYSYDVSYYHHWKNILERDDWSYGLFGENLTTEGLPDHQICVGSIYQTGSVLLKAVQPRFPCYKLNIRFNDEGMLKQFTKEAKNGTYFSIAQEGSLQVGDQIKLVEASKHKVTIQQLVDSYYNKGADKELLHAILDIEILPEGLRRGFESFVNN